MKPLLKKYLFRTTAACLIFLAQFALDAEFASATDCRDIAMRSVSPNPVNLGNPDLTSGDYTVTIASGSFPEGSLGVMVQDTEEPEDWAIGQIQASAERGLARLLLPIDFLARKRRVNVVLVCSQGGRRYSSNPIELQINQESSCNPCTFPLTDSPGCTDFRIATESDGNEHDPDDIGAITMACAYAAAAGHADRYTFLGHSNHLVVHGDGQGADTELSALLCAEFGVDENVIFDDQEETEAAVNALAAEMAASTECNPLFLLVGGPFEITYRAAMRALELTEGEPDPLEHVTVVSHAGWNNDHAHGTERTAHDLQHDTDVNFVQLNNQNFYSHNPPGTHMYHWDWLLDLGYPWQHAYDRTNQAGEYKDGIARNDCSDAGMMFTLVTGNPYATMSDIEGHFPD